MGNSVQSYAWQGSGVVSVTTCSLRIARGGGGDQPSDEHAVQLLIVNFLQNVLRWHAICCSIPPVAAA